MTDLSWHFAQPAEAVDAYVVTELGNLFQVETPNTGAIGSNTGLDILNSGVTQALLGFMAGITEEKTDFEYLTGTGPIGELHEYSSFFAIPPTVANSSNGYVGIYLADGPHTSVHIPNFFSTYRYNNPSNTLSDIGLSDAMPVFNSIAVQSSTSSKKINGNVNSNGYGFYAYNGTYIVKLHPGYAYTIPNGIWCHGALCNTASVISSNSHLLQTTTNGLHLLTTNSVGNKGSWVDTGTITRPKTNQYGTTTISLTGTLNVYASVPSTQISGSAHITGPTPVLDYNLERRCGTNTYNFHSDPIPYTGALFSRRTIDTWTSDGKVFINEIIFGTPFQSTLSHVSAYSQAWTGCSLSYSGVWSQGGHIGYCETRCYLANPSYNTATFTPTSQPGTLTYYDTGIPVAEHFAHWSEDNSTMPFRDTGTAMNPNNVVVRDNNIYMVISNNLGSTISVDGHDVASAALRITDLPRNKIYSLTGTGLADAIVGVIDEHGEIQIMNSSRFVGINDLTLNVFHDSIVFRNLSGMTVVDHFNNAHFNMASAKHDGTVYTTTKYVDLPIPLDDTEIDSVGVGLNDCKDSRLDLQYLAGTYNGGDNLMVPVIPGFDRVCYAIGDKTLTLKYSDIRQSDNVDFGESEAASNDIDTVMHGPSGAVSTVTIPITAVNGDSLTFGVEGMVTGDTDLFYGRQYFGEVRAPGVASPLINPGLHPTERYGSFCDPAINIPGWVEGHILNREHSSREPVATGTVTVEVSVSKNGNVVFTKSMFSEAVSDINIRHINNGQPEIRVGEFTITTYTINGFLYWCGAEDTSYHNDLLDKIASGEYMLCNSGTYHVFHPIRGIVPVCEKPVSLTTCGYDVTQRLQRSAFGETITIENVEIGDVVDVEVRASNTASLEEFACHSILEGTFKRGTIDVEILNPSVQVQ